MTTVKLFSAANPQQGDSIAVTLKAKSLGRGEFLGNRLLSRPTGRGGGGGGRLNHLELNEKHTLPPVVHVADRQPGSIPSGPQLVAGQLLNCQPTDGAVPVRGQCGFERGCFGCVLVPSVGAIPQLAYHICHTLLRLYTVKNLSHNSLFHGMYCCFLFRLPPIIVPRSCSYHPWAFRFP